MHEVYVPKTCIDFMLIFDFSCDPVEHAEALTSILLLLKRESPTIDLLKHIVSRDAREKDRFVVSVLKYWSGGENGEKLSELISTQLTKNSTMKRKR